MSLLVATRTRFQLKVEIISLTLRRFRFLSLAESTNLVVGRSRLGNPVVVLLVPNN